MNRALGIDHGDARIGLAVSDELRMLAHPLETVQNNPKALQRIKSVVADKCVDAIVIGLPKNMDGTRGEAAKKVEAFAAAIRADHPGLRVVLWDERLTTVAAQRALQEAGRNAKNSRSVVDQVAAQMILQGWLDSQSMLSP